MTKAIGPLRLIASRSCAYKRLSLRHEILSVNRPSTMLGPTDGIPVAFKTVSIDMPAVPRSNLEK
jgi:hypothetical protein